MGQPAAKQGDRVVATDIHLVRVGTPPTASLPHPFSGTINGQLSPNVKIEGKPAATVGSRAKNDPPHTPTSPGVDFVTPPSNLGSIQTGSMSVRINGKPAARNGDTAVTCNDPVDLPVGKVVATGTVFIGG